MKRLLVCTISLAALAVAGNARAQTAELPDNLELGRDSRGQPCSASRYWGDPAIKDPFATSYAITCRGAIGNRYLGVVRSIKRAGDMASLDAALQCGAASEVTVPGLGPARARRCFDSLIGFETVETSLERGGQRLSVSVIGTGQGPGEEALRLLAGAAEVNPNRNRTSTAAVAVEGLAPAPAAGAASALTADASAAMEEGLRLLRAGLHVEASRVFNDALGRLSADAPVADRIELLLMSGLADSNLRFFAEAEADFARASELLEANPNLPRAAELMRKRQSYAALDLLNRRSFNDAISALEQLASGPADPGQPLTDPGIVRTLNQSPGSQAESAMLATADVGTLSQLVIDAQASWARSVALLAQNRPQDAAAALQDADRNFAVLRNEPVDLGQLLWLDARIERQRARIQAREGNWNAATDALDRAIASLEMAGASGTSFGPTLAETRLQRASIAARGGNRNEAMAQFELGIEDLINSDALGAMLPSSVEQYLDLLVAEAERNPAGDAAEKFFRAIQAVGDPEVARQTAELHSVVTEGEALAVKVQDRNDMERELRRILYEIVSVPEGEAARIAELEAERQRLENGLVQIDSELAANQSYSALNDAPVTIAELRSALRPGEAYFKVVQLPNYAFGMLVDDRGAQIYRVAVPLVELNPVIDTVRRSIDGAGSETLPAFNVAAAYALFQLIAGPAADRLLSAGTVIVDPSGPLQNLPIGVLVTDRESVETFRRSRQDNAYDYTGVNFLARQVAISSALSPRSLLTARGLTPSNAPLPFIGFAQHMPIQLAGGTEGQTISIGTGCEAELSQIALLTRALRPIDKRELERAGAALGVVDAPIVTDAAFTDTAIKQRADLNQFQVLHFATHGLTEGQWGCAKAPPALVTSFGGEGSDSILSFDEIAKLDLDANLVVLSACDTAAGVRSEAVARAAGLETTGASLEGLVRSFLAAKARAVLTTYWPISDEGESEQLIEAFYAAARNATIGEGLKTAQTSLMARTETSHPYFWGAFFVIGDATKPLLSGGAQQRLASAAAADGEAS